MSQDKYGYYLDIAETVSKKSTCLRRRYGAIIVKNDEIISSGYNGSPRGCINCKDIGCIRECLNVGKGDSYGICTSVHAEMNAIISAARRDMIGATLFIVGIEATTGAYADPAPCILCQRMIINAGIELVIGRTQSSEQYPDGIIALPFGPSHFTNMLVAKYKKLISEMEQQERAQQGISPDEPWDGQSDQLKQAMTLYQKYVDSIRTTMIDECVSNISKRFLSGGMLY